MPPELLPPPLAGAVAVPAAGAVVPPDAGALAEVVPALAPPLVAGEAVVLELELVLELEFVDDAAAAGTFTPLVGTVKPGAPAVFVVPVPPLPQPASASASATAAAVPVRAAGRMARLLLTGGAPRSRAAPYAARSADSR